jgi:signal transduction histidine kinase
MNSRNQSDFSEVISDRSIHDEVIGYFRTRATNLLFVLTKEAIIVEANAYACTLTGKDLVDRKIQDVVIDFSGGFDLAALVSDQSQEHLISVSSASGLPQSYYFTFKQVSEYILAFGRQDVQELESMHKEVLTLNQALNNQTRELNKKNTLLIQKEKALTQSISDLKLAQAKLVESEKMASLGRLVAGFSHEINTPIGIALTASTSILESSQQIEQMLMQDEVEEDDLTSTLETIRDASKLVFTNLNRSADLVRSFKRTSIDQSIENLSLYSLNDTIMDVLTSMRIKIKNTSIKAVFDSRENISMFGNPGDIFQILSNLFENSVIHAFENGRLDGEIVIAVQKKEKDILIHYSDTGKGMSTEIVEKIFEPFYTTLRARGGTGLGMYICHNIVTSRLKGTIECTSVQGKGTEFSITVPITKDEIHEAEKITK